MSRKSFRKRMEQRLKESEIVPILPCALGQPEALPDGIAGATITAIGSIDGEESGLVIEYRDKQSGIVRQVLLGFGDAGMCVSAIVRT